VDSGAIRESPRAVAFRGPTGSHRPYHPKPRKKGAARVRERPSTRRRYLQMTEPSIASPIGEEGIHFLAETYGLYFTCTDAVVVEVSKADLTTMPSRDRAVLRALLEYTAGRLMRAELEIGLCTPAVES
jgi:hypothetical protein